MEAHQFEDMRKVSELDMLTKPAPDEYNPYFAKYIELVRERKLEQDLQHSVVRLVSQLGNLSEAQALYRYEPSKWSIKQLLGHLADTERVMCYRILRIARGDNQTTLFGFDENLFVASAHFDEQSLSIRIHEMQVVRQASLVLFQSIHDEAWLRRTIFRDYDTSARAIAFFMAGHFHHHCQVLEQRYLPHVK
jgi:hypothetical protein